ncbi:hypothetical protein V6N13_068312 [Hibiscus sabdariffa]
MPLQSDNSDFAPVQSDAGCKSHVSSLVGSLNQAPRIDHGAGHNGVHLPDQETNFSPLVQNKEPDLPSVFSRQNKEEVQLPQSDLRFPSAPILLDNVDSLRATTYESQEDQSVGLPFVQNFHPMMVFQRCGVITPVR